MRKTLTLSLLLLLQMIAVSSFAQKASDKTVTINMTDVTVKQLFAEVRKQTGLNFLYSSELSKTFPKVTVKAQNKPVREVLDDVMRRIKCVYEIDGTLVTVKPGTKPVEASGRTRKISGVVRDADGEPLVGVPISIGDGNVVAVTDANGSYTVTIPVEQTVLRYSYVGMETAYVTVPSGGQDVTRDMVLRSDNRLDNVIVTGYQTINKEKMTGAASTINSEKLSERYATNVMDNLEGRVAGLSTYGGKMMVRGISSIYSNTNPLLVVDGVPVEASIESINPYDIETVNVLKDAAATAIYGARASNGVIVITTKKARTANKIDIDFSANLTVKEKQNIDYSDNFYMNAAEQVDVASKYWEYYFFNNGGKVADPISESQSKISQGSYFIDPVEYAYLNLAKGDISRDQLNNTLSRLRGNNYAKEYADNILRQQVLQQYNLSLRFLSEKSQNNLTLNYRTDNTGRINAHERELNVNYKGIFNLASWLTATANINAVYNNTQAPGSDYSNMLSNPWQYPAYITMYNEDGSFKKMYGYMSGNEYYDANMLQKGMESLGFIPTDEIYNNTRNSKRQHMRYHGELSFNIIEGLQAKTMFIYEVDKLNSRWHCNSASVVARTLRNAYSSYDATSDKVVYNVPSSGGLLRITDTDGESWTARGQVNYFKNFGKHEINAIAGLEFRETLSKGANNMLLGYDDQLQTSGTINTNLAILANQSYSSYYMTNTGSFYARSYAYGPYLQDGITPVMERHHRFASGYANLTYSFDERYHLFGSFRKDYADVYGLNAKYRGRPLWSVGASWNIHKEGFMLDNNLFNILKLRASYGVTGNIYQDATSVLTASTEKSNMYTGLLYGEISPANPNLKWEQSFTTNVGIDFSLMNYRLNGSLDYYNKKTEDMFSNKVIDPTSGFSTMFVNAASMVNKGVELQLGYDWLVPKSEKDVAWTTNFTLSYNKNEITDVENPSTQSYQLLSLPYRKGYPVTAIWSYRFAGISNGEDGGRAGETMWYINGDQKSHSAMTANADCLEYSGTSTPKITMGLNNRIAWNGFSLSIMMAYYGGHRMRCLVENDIQKLGNGVILGKYFLDSWTPEKPTTHPGLGEYDASSIGVEPGYGNNAVYDASFLKIRNIVLGYEFPSRIIKPLGINRLALNFQIDNLKAIWTANGLGVDPETLSVRNPSSFIFGLNINL